MTPFDFCVFILLAYLIFQLGRRYQSHKLMPHIERLTESFARLEELILEEKGKDP